MAPMKRTIDHGSNLDVAQLVVAVIFSLLAVLAVLLRIRSRRKARVYLDLSDYMIFIALAATLCGTIATIVGVAAGGIGLSEAHSTRHQTFLYQKAIFANAFSWPIAQSTTKISIGIFYLHLSSLRKFRISVYVIIVVVSVWCFEEVLANLLLCKPIDYIWDKSLDGHCVNVVAHSLASAAFNLFTDISILILPIPVLWRLRLVIKDKAGLFLIFGFGSCICVISAVRLKVLVPGSTQNGEFYHNGLSVLFTILEDSLAVTYACFIVVRPLFEGSPRSINSSSDKPRTQTNSNNNVTTRRNKVRISAPSGFVHVNGHSIMSFENLEPCKNATNLEARSITGQDWTSDDEEISIEQIAKY